MTAAGPTTSVETISPTTAAAWLAHNTHNRTLNRVTVAVYARDMKAGRWHFTGEAVKWSTGGVLLDGQHRLAAIIEADVPVKMVVVRGLVPESQDAMDTGRRRTAGDALGLHGEKRATNLAATAKLILTDGDRRNYRPTQPEVLALIAEDPAIRIIVNDILPPLQIKVTTLSLQAYVYWRLDRIDSSDTAKFFDALSTLADLPAGSPVLALHKRLSAHVRQSSSQIYRQEVCTYFFQAWNAWRKGETRAIVKLGYVGGRVSIPEPI